MDLVDGIDAELRSAFGRLKPSLDHGSDAILLVDCPPNQRRVGFTKVVTRGFRICRRVNGRKCQAMLLGMWTNSKKTQSQRLVAGFAMQIKKRILELSGGVSRVGACAERAINSTNIEFLWMKERGKISKNRVNLGL